MSPELPHPGDAKFTPIELPETPPVDRHVPVELERGPETLRLVHESIEHFRDFEQQLPLGPQTRGAYDQLVDNVASRPDGIQVFAKNDKSIGRLIPDAMFHGWNPNTDGSIKLNEFIVEVTPSAIDGDLTDESAELGRALGVEIDPDEARELAYAHLIGHELAHGIQKAYSYVMPAEPLEYFPTPLYKHLEADAITAGLTQPVEVAAAPTQSRIIESERLTEGIAQEFMLSEFVRRGLVAADDDAQLQKLRETLINQRRHEKFAKTLAIIQSVPGPPEETARQFFDKLDEAGLMANYVGYGMPYDRETIDRVLALTP